jgi:hypothetical protein
MAGIVAADYRNAHGGRGEGAPPYSPLDFTPCEEMTREEIAQEQEEQNREALARALGSGLIKEKK